MVPCSVRINILKDVPTITDQDLKMKYKVPILLLVEKSSLFGFWRYDFMVKKKKLKLFAEMAGLDKFVVVVNLFLKNRFSFIMSKRKFSSLV